MEAERACLQEASPTQGQATDGYQKNHAATSEGAVQPHRQRKKPGQNQTPSHILSQQVSAPRKTQPLQESHPAPTPSKGTPLTYAAPPVLTDATPELPTPDSANQNEPPAEEAPLQAPCDSRASPQCQGHPMPQSPPKHQHDSQSLPRQQSLAHATSTHALNHVKRDRPAKPAAAEPAPSGSHHRRPGLPTAPSRSLATNPDHRHFAVHATMAPAHNKRHPTQPVQPRSQTISR